MLWSSSSGFTPEGVRACILQHHAAFNCRSASSAHRLAHFLACIVRCPPLEAWRIFASHVEATFQRKTGASQGAFLKKTSDESDAMRDPARRGEFGKRLGRIGSPVTAGLGDLDEASA